MKALALIALVSGCWRGGEQAPEVQPSPQPAHVAPRRRVPAPPPRGEEVLRAFTRFRDDMCACGDQSCATGIQDEMQRWGEQQAARADPLRPGDELLQQIQSIAQEYAECMMKAMTQPGP